MIRNVSVISDGGQAGDGGRGRRWLVLAGGTVALTAGSAFQYGLGLLYGLTNIGVPCWQVFLP